MIIVHRHFVVQSSTSLTPRTTMKRFLRIAANGWALLGWLLLAPIAAANSAAAGPGAYFPGLDDDEREDYASWVASRSSSYPRHAFAAATPGDPDVGAAVFWNVDGSTISFAVAARAEGWVGFGISEAGGMLGSDIALYEASASALTDRHVIEAHAEPLLDECQDWTLNDATVGGGWIIVEVSRSLDTGDKQDHAIKADADFWTAPTRIIAAWGDSSSISYHGSNKARSAVRIFGDSVDGKSELEALVSELESESDGYFDVREDNHEITNEETQYHSICTRADELNVDLSQDQGVVTSIGAVPILTKETAHLVHHFVLFAQADCSGDAYMNRQLIYVWAPGNDGWKLPSDVGLPLFSDDSSQALYLEIHYNNPMGIEDMLDSSGVRLYYSESKRTHDAAILELGDPWIILEGQRISEGLTQYSFTCPSACSSSFLSSGPVTVLAEYLHMHQTGVRMTSEVIRDGSVFHTATAEVYDFDQQGGLHVQQEAFELLPGDSMRTTCYYRDGDKFGLSSDEEMCIGYMMYYPAKRLYGYPWICQYKSWPDEGFGCTSELESRDLDSIDDLGRIFGSPSSQCAVNPTSTSPTTGAPTTGTPTGRPTATGTLPPATVSPVEETVTATDKPTTLAPESAGTLSPFQAPKSATDTLSPMTVSPVETTTAAPSPGPPVTSPPTPATVAVQANEAGLLNVSLVATYAVTFIVFLSSAL